MIYDLRKKNIKILFFGSTTDSVIVLEKLLNYQSFGKAQNKKSINNYQLIGVVTQPPRPIGRKQAVTETPVSIRAKKNKIPVYTFPTQLQNSWLFENETDVISSLESLKPDLLITASFGQRIPNKLIRLARYHGLNIHPSLLPQWRGADPVPWAILSGDKFTGVTLVTLSDNFDEGEIISQKRVEIKNNEYPDPLRRKLFEIGAELLINYLQQGLALKNVKAKPLSALTYPYAYRFTRNDGFVPWEVISAAITGKPYEKTIVNKFNCIAVVKKLIKQNVTLDLDITRFIERMVRALTPWPGVWTTLSSKFKVQSSKLLNKRLKILKTHLKDEKLVIDLVQLEGKKPVSFSQFQKAYSII